MKVVSPGPPSKGPGRNTAAPVDYDAAMSGSQGWFNYGDDVGARSAGRHLRRRRRPAELVWFRSVDLNALGWLTLIGSGVVLSAAIAATSGIEPAVSTVIGFAAAYAAARALDWHHWRQITFGTSTSDLTVDQAVAVVERLRAAGHDVSLELEPQVFADDPPVEWSIQSTNRHRSAVDTAISEALDENRSGQ